MRLSTTRTQSSQSSLIVLIGQHLKQSFLMQLKVSINPIYSYLMKHVLPPPSERWTTSFALFYLVVLKACWLLFLPGQLKRDKRDQRRNDSNFFHYKASETLQHIASTVLKPGAAVLHGETWPLWESIWELDKSISEWNLQYDCWKPKTLPSRQQECFQNYSN